MKFVVDENVSYGLVVRLRELGHEVISISESAEKGISDERIYALVLKEQSVFITSDYHFTNPIRFPTQKTKGIICIRQGSLKSDEEIAVVENFISVYAQEKLQGKLVLLYKDSIRIR
jgi:predicted nuclease of predicted toxin-antitoxin system